MDLESIRQHLAQDLPEYELAPDSTIEDAGADEAGQVESNAGTLGAWRGLSSVRRSVKPDVLSETSKLKERFRKREL